jgi:RimJ/RimL family protein N-acetyltransferase
MSRNSIALTRLDSSDIPSLADLANNKNIYDHVRDLFPHPYKESDAKSFINKTLKEIPEVTFAIKCKKELCGVIGLSPQEDVYRKSAEVGYWIGEIFWGKGIVTEALRLITKYGFEKLALIRIYTGVFEGNNASMKVLEKNGYKKEGVFVKSILKNGRILNEHRYAITI